MATRYYTLSEANELVPWLKETFGRLASLTQRMGQGQRELLDVLRQSKRNGHSDTGAQIQEKRREIKAATEETNRMLREITDKGIEVRDVARGLVDFPSQRDGRDVYLCWTLRENQVKFWHETDAGFAGRQPL